MQRANDVTRARRVSGQPWDAASYAELQQPAADGQMSCRHLESMMSYQNPTPSNSIDAYLLEEHQLELKLRPGLWSNTHDTRSRNRRHKSTPFSGDGFRRRFFVPCTSGVNISAAENKCG